MMKTSILLHLTISILILAIWTGTTWGQLMPPGLAEALAKGGHVKCDKNGNACVGSKYGDDEFSMKECIGDKPGGKWAWCATSTYSDDTYKNWDWGCKDC